MPGLPGAPGGVVKGSKGEPGVCSPSQCSAVRSNGKGDRGLDGLPGEHNSWDS